MSKKRNNAANNKAGAETDIEKLDRYESDRSDDELKKLQTRKSVCFFVSVAMLVITMFLPSDSTWNKSHPRLLFAFTTLNILGLIYAIFMLFQDNRKHKIQKTVLKKNAPKFGYDKGSTYVTYEVFVVYMLFFVVEQCVVVAWARDAWAIVGLCLMAAGFVCSLVARFTLVNANAGHMTFIDVEPKEEKTPKPETPESATPESDAPKSEDESTQEVTSDPDDFYSSPKEKP